MNTKMPKSCQENWLELSPSEKVRFCNLCQKNIFQTDTESNSEQNICLRYSTNNDVHKKNFSHKIKHFILTRIKKNRAN
jgi:hypothetical protein